MNKLASICLPLRRLLAIAAAAGLAIAAAAPAQTAPVFSTTQPTSYLFAEPTRIVLADFNADGKADLATLGYQNGNTGQVPYLEVYLGNGDGTFATFPSAYARVDGCAAVRGMAAYGRDITGSLNLAVLCYDTLQVWHVTFNAGSASQPLSLIDDPAHRQVISLDTGGVAMAVGDFTASGSPGIAVLELGATNTHAGTIAIYPGPSPCSLCTTSSTFAQLVTLPVMVDASGSYGSSDVGVAIAAIQVPPNNAAGFAVATFILGNCGGKVISYTYDGSGFNLGDVYQVPQHLCPSSLAAGDLDGDGFSDLVVGGGRSNSTSGFLMTFTGGGDGSFSPVSPTPFSTQAPAPNDSGEMAILDLNGDGYADLVVAGPQPNGVSTRSATVNVYLGNGDGTFADPFTTGPDVSGSNSSGLSKGVLAVSPGNINLDGSPEFATIDLVGNGYGGGVGDLTPLSASLIQTFTDHTNATTTTISAGNAHPLLKPGPTAKSIRPKPRYFGSDATTLQATVSPIDASGWVQFFDATTQTWLGSSELNNGTASLTIQVSGTHYYIASFYGSPTWQGSSSDAQQIGPQKQPSYTSIDVTPTTAAPGAPVTLSANVSGQAISHPTGTVAFIDNNTGTTLATAALDSSGNASATLTTLGVNQYDVIGTYSGDTNYDPSTSSDVPLTIAVALFPDTLTLTATPTTANSGTAISATATIVGSGSAIPSGNLLFQVDGVTAATVAITSGSATATLNPLVGPHQLQVLYAGDGISAPSVSNTIAITIHGGVLQLTPGAASVIAGIPGTDLRYGYGGDGGPALAAHLHTPLTVSAGNGSIYIADEENNVIRKVTPDGTISTVAGVQYQGSIYSTRFGGDGGPATQAYLDYPTGVALDPAGNLFIADYDNNVIRRVDAVTGIITSVAGAAGHRGYNGPSGPATSVFLDNPAAIAFDGAGNLYIADKGNDLVRKVDTSGTMTTVAGHYGYSSGPSYGGPANVSTLKQPEGIAVDPAGTIYIADTGNNVIAKVDTSGIVTRFAGGNYVYNSGDGGPATSAQISQPFQLSLDTAGDLYIADGGDGVIRKVDTAGIITTVAGIYGTSSSGLYDPAGAPATGAPLTAASGVFAEPAGSLLIADTYDQTIWRVGPAGAAVFGPQAPGTTSTPQIVTLSNVGDQPIVFQATPFTITGDYTLTSEGSAPCSFTAGLAVGVSCTVAIRYQPSTSALSGLVTFASNASGTPTIHLRTNPNVLPTTTQLQFSSNPAQLGDSVLLYASVGGAPNAANPTGTFLFYEGTTLLGSATATSTSGGAYGYILISTLPLGNHTITASYSGDGSYAASVSDPAILTINPISTSVALTSSATSTNFGDSITFTAALTVTSTAAPLTTGSITFFDGASPLATVNVDATGTATFSTSSLSAGSHSITATYSAQGNYATSTSAVITVTVTSSGGGGGGGGGFGFDYVLNSIGVPVTLHRGDTATLGLDIEPVGPFPGTIHFSCGTLPSYATCSFSPATVNINGQQPPTVVWTITTTPH